MDKTEKFRSKYGPWAVIAGGSEGLGLAFSEAIAAAGLNIVVVARREELLEQTRAKISENYQVTVQTIPGDLSDLGFLKTVLGETGNLDIGLLVYNACESIVAPFLDVDIDDHQRILDTNCRAPLLLAHAFGSRFVRRGKGGILLMSSMSGLQGTPFVAGYAATKAYNTILAQSLWEEFKKSHVDVMACIAGATLTPNYIRSKPAGATSAAPEMEPEAVVADALRTLGRQPSMVPGLLNKAAVALLRRFAGTKSSISVVSKNMHKLYGEVVHKR